MYVKVVDERDDEPPCAILAPRKRLKLEHDLKVGRRLQTLADMPLMYYGVLAQCNYLWDRHCGCLIGALVMSCMRQGVQ